MGLLKAIGIVIVALFCLLGVLIFAGIVYIAWPIILALLVIFGLPLLLIWLLV